MLWEVEGKWVVQGAVNVDIGANPSAEGGEDEGVDDQAVKVVDIVDTFRLQEQPSFDKKQFVAFIKKYIKLLTPKLKPEKQESFKKHIEGATKFLLPKLKDLQFFVGESMHDDSTMVFAYYKDGATDPTFLYFAYGLKEVKCWKTRTFLWGILARALHIISDFLFIYFIVLGQFLVGLGLKLAVLIFSLIITSN